MDMKEAIIFNATIYTGKENVQIDIPQALAGKEPPQSLTPQEATAMGLDIGLCKNADGTPAFSESEISKLRYENHIGKSVKANDIPETCKLDSLESLREREAAKLLGCKQVISIVEDVDLRLCIAEHKDIHNLSEELAISIDPLALRCASLDAANIHITKPIDNQEFVNTDIVENDQSTRLCNQLSVKIYKSILHLKKIRSYQGDLYLYDEANSVYQILSSNDLHYLINSYFGELIAQQGNTSYYYQAEDFIRKDSEILIRDSNFLPLEYWGFLDGFYNIYDYTRIINNGKYFIRHVLHSKFDSNATCHNFDKFIYSIAAGDERIINLLWQVIGYLLSNDTNGKVFFAFIGKKDTGKSLLANIISHIIGEDAISYLSANDFSGRFDVSDLKGKQLNICMDLPDRALSPESVGKIKSITGNDIIRSDVKHKSSTNFKPNARLLFGSNSLIRTEKPDSAFFERLIIIPFLYPIPKDKQDYDLHRKLISETNGICLKALEYYKQLRSNGYKFSITSVPYSLDTSIDYSKVIQKFAADFCLFTQCDDDKISSEELYKAFENYCNSKAISPLKQTDFSKKFKDIFEDKTDKKKIKLNGFSLNGFTRIRLKGEICK